MLCWIFRNGLVDGINRRCGRNREDVRIIAVTKYSTIEVTKQVLRLGITHIGESRAQEALTKWESLHPQGTWHFIGHLQTNKVKDVVGRFDYIHLNDFEIAIEEGATWLRIGSLLVGR